MSILVNTPDELGKALKGNPLRIDLSGDLHNNIFRIKSLGRVLWAVALGAISAGVATFLHSRGLTGPGEPMLYAAPAFRAAPSVATAIMGISTSLAAISIAISGGGVGVLSSLRKNYLLVGNRYNARLIRR